MAHTSRTLTCSGWLPPTRSARHIQSLLTASPAPALGLSPAHRETASAVGALEAPGMALAGPGESPGFVAEQLRVEQIIVQRRAVQRDKRPLPAAGEVVETVSDKLFPGAALADDQHRFIQAGPAGKPVPAPRESCWPRPADYPCTAP